MTQTPHSPWTIDAVKQPLLGVKKGDPGLVGKTIWLLTPDSLEALPDGHEVISIFGEREPKELADDDTRGGFLAYGLLPDVWHSHFGSAVDKLAALKDDEA